MKFKLENNPILAPYQIKILKLFFKSVLGKTFFLTGGTALAAFYLAHRESKDLDLFSIDAFDGRRLDETIEGIARDMKARVRVKVKSETYNEIYLENQDEGWQQRIDIVKEQPKHFGKIETVEEIRVDALVNIATNKILAMYGRFEPKDYIDLYMILTRTELKFDELFELAKQKDAGLFEFYFANLILGVEKIETWPVMKVELNAGQMKFFYQDLARELLLRVKPKK